MGCVRQDTEINADYSKEEKYSQKDLCKTSTPEVGQSEYREGDRNLGGFT